MSGLPCSYISTLSPRSPAERVVLRDHLPEIEGEKILGRAVDVFPEIVLRVEERLPVRLPAGDRRPRRGGASTDRPIPARRTARREQQRHRGRRYQRILHTITFAPAKKPSAASRAFIIAKPAQRRVPIITLDFPGARPIISKRRPRAHSRPPAGAGGRRPVS